MRWGDSLGSGDNAVEARGLAITFERWGQKVQALSAVSFVVPQGQWLILTGPNGSGKSTLLRAIAGEISVPTGSLRIKGMDVNSLARRQLATHVFLVRQDPAAGSVSNLTPHENLMVADESRDSRKALDARHRRLLERIHLDDRDRQPAGTLSSGQRQVLALLMAQLRLASVLLLDEPFAALDESNAQVGMELLKELHHDGRTIIQVSHDPSMITSVGQRVLTLSRGEIALDQLRVA